MKKIAFATYGEKPEISAAQFNRDDLWSKALQDKGFTVLAAPWDDDGTDWSKYDAVVLRTTCDYQFRLVEFHEWIKRLQAIGVHLLNAPDIVLWNSHKRYLLDLQARGVSIPTSEVVRQNSTPDGILETFYAKNKLNKIVVKPCVSADAYETYAVCLKDIDKFMTKFRDMVKHMDVVIQEYVGDIEFCGEWELCYFDKKLSHAVNRLPASGDFRVHEFYGGSTEGCKPPEVVIVFCDFVLSVINSRLLYARVDVVRKPNGQVLLMELELIEPSLYFDVDYTGRAAEIAACCLENILCS